MTGWLSETVCNAFTDYFSPLQMFRRFAVRAVREVGARDAAWARSLALIDWLGWAIDMSAELTDLGVDELCFLTPSYFRGQFFDWLAFDEFTGPCPIEWIPLTAR